MESKQTLPTLAARVARLEQMASEHLGIDLAAYDEAAQAAKDAWIADNPEHSELTAGEEPEDDEPEPEVEPS